MEWIRGSYDGASGFTVNFIHSSFKPSYKMFSILPRIKLQVLEDSNMIWALLPILSHLPLAFSATDTLISLLSTKHTKLTPTICYPTAWKVLFLNDSFSCCHSNFYSCTLEREYSSPLSKTVTAESCAPFCTMYEFSDTTVIKYHELGTLRH